jgi:hypothetical protein
MRHGMFLPLLTGFLALAALAILSPASMAENAPRGTVPGVGGELSPDPAGEGETRKGSVLPPAPWFLEWERSRIESHLEQVEEELRRRTPMHLSPRQREARLRQLDRLRSYRLAGEFPRNLELPGRRVPVFRDDRGVLCAVGFLLAADGHGELVDRVARTRNLARIPELADESGLLEWLDTNGLSVDEATWIQPAYQGWPSPEPETPPIPSRYRATSLAAGMVGGLATGWNLVGLRRGDVPSLGVTLGLAAGASSLMLGASRLDEEGVELRRLAVVNLVAGAVSVGTALHSGRRIRVEVQPWILPQEVPPPDEKTGDGAVRAMGVKATLRF